MARIAIITSHAGSLANFRGPLLRTLEERGHCVLALAPDYDDTTIEAVRALGAEPVSYRLSRTAIDPLRDLGDLLRLKRLLQSLRVDACLTYFIKPVIYGTIAARLAGIERRFALIEGLGFVFTQAPAGASHSRRFLRGGVALLYRLALRGAKRVIFLNRDDMAEFIGRRIVPSEKAALLGGIGVDLDDWRSRGPTTSPLTFVLVARLLREKGICEFVEAARAIRRCRPDAIFRVVGGPDENPGGLTRETMEAWVREGIIEWTGNVSVKPWLERASVFVLPSYYREGVPRSIQEAMAMGLPIITTDMPGCRDTVVDGRNGFLVPAHDHAALVAAIRVFVVNPGLVASMGQQSRAMAEERYDVHAVNERLLALLGLAGASTS